MEDKKPVPSMKSGKDEALPDGSKPDEGNQKPKKPADTPIETGGPQGLEPTRFGDWERKGRCVDF